MKTYKQVMKMAVKIIMEALEIHSKSLMAQNQNQKKPKQNRNKVLENLGKAKAKMQHAIFMTTARENVVKF